MQDIKSSEQAVSIHDKSATMGQEMDLVIHIFFSARPAVDAVTFVVRDFWSLIAFHFHSQSAATDPDPCNIRALRSVGD